MAIALPGDGGHAMGAHASPESEVIRHKCIWEITGAAAAQARLALRLRAHLGLVVEFDRRPEGDRA